MDGPQPGQPVAGGTPDMLPPQLALTAERLAFLRPRLQALLADLQELDAIVAPDSEPAFAPFSAEEWADDAR